MRSKLLFRFWMALLIGLFSCSPRLELAPPDNPLDPDNPDYEPPTAVITYGIADGGVSTKDSVTFSWNGNVITRDFSYRFDDSNWSGWTTSKTVTFSYLDELPHRFEVRARGENDEIQEIPTSSGFITDAIEGASLILFPYRQTSNVGDTLTVAVMLEEVTDIIGAEFTLTYDPTGFLFIDSQTGAFADSIQATGLQVVEVDPVPGKVSASVTAAAGSAKSFSGTASLIMISLKTVKAGTFTLTLGNGVLVDSNRQPVTINRLRGELLVVK
ncbi:MAG: cohesin domain-containing protein [Candidatus Neomarinimicrobiota bacterium]